MPDEAQTVHVHHASPIRGYEDEAAPFAKRALLFDRGPVPETSSMVLREDNQLLMGAEAESIVELLRATLPGGTARRVFALMAVGVARDSGLVIAQAAMLPGIAENVVARAAFDAPSVAHARQLLKLASAESTGVDPHDRALLDAAEGHVASLRADLAQRDALIADLTRERDEARATCVAHAGAAHGGEAKELREGIERLIAGRSGKVWAAALRDLLDDVDARDSLAAEELEERRRQEVAKLTRERDEARAEALA